MTLPQGLREPIKKRALERRKQFKDESQLILNGNKGINHQILRDHLITAKQLLEDYDALYFDDINDKSVKHLTSTLHHYRNKCKKSFSDLESNPENFDVFKLQDIIKTVLHTIERYEDMTTSMGCKDFTIKKL